jgi:hypothetical protein
MQLPEDLSDLTNLLVKVGSLARVARWAGLLSMALSMCECT